MNDPPHQQTNTTIAAFDFDDTLTYQDTLFPFLRMVVGRWRFWWGLLLLSPILLGYALRLVPNWRAKEAVLTYFLAGLTEKELDRLGHCFTLEKLPKLLRPEAVERLRWHQKMHHQTILISASLEVYLRPWADQMGFDHIIGTQLEVSEGLLTGKIYDQNCYGKEKVARLQTLLGDLSQYCIYAYGDSNGDKELLAAANYSYYRSFIEPVTPESKSLISSPYN